ncbi:hypothetical protein FA13DRAFT_1305789 [Coprinellus micaceus]|uniref:Uncharacterized protein n=1 Tax=Coprinellus micaceus TaxID=71717 RepID=A0A4Y7SRR8_COPMI|nr:hypothetical protein FA13DRAFT_1305789 [Coprinellus micaceus]
MIPGTTRAGSGAAPHRNSASHGIVVKQEPNEHTGFQGMPMHSVVGVQAVPPLPVRTIYNYRELPGRGNAAVFQPIQPVVRRLEASCSVPLMYPQPVVKVERPEPRLCAAMNCPVILPMNYPHLRCRTCRARNVPRRPELSTVLTPAQLLARDRKYQVAPPLPSRVVPSLAAPGGHAPPPLPFRRPQPPPPPPPLPSRFRQPLPQAQVPGAQQVVPSANPSPSCPAPPVAVCKVDPDIDADIALQALLKVRCPPR